MRVAFFSILLDTSRDKLKIVLLKAGLLHIQSGDITCHYLIELLPQYLGTEIVNCTLSNSFLIVIFPTKKEEIK